MAQGAADVAKPVSLPDMALGPPGRLGDHHRIRLDDLPALRGLQRRACSRRSSRPISTPARCATSSANSRSTSRPRPARCWRAASPRTTPANISPSIDMLFKQQNDWVMKNTTETLTRIGKQAGLSQQSGRGLPEGPGAARQDRRRPEIRRRRAEGEFDADLLHQWRGHQGRSLVRGVRQEDQIAAEELIRSRTICHVQTKAS